jgi:orotate phosphoribosyltransferase
MKWSLPSSTSSTLRLKFFAVLFFATICDSMRLSCRSDIANSIIKLYDKTVLDTIQILKECEALLEGHFLLSSGRHSNRYFQCARLLRYPGKAALVLSPLAEAIRARVKSGELKADAVVGPAMGGIIVAYELGRQLGLPAFWTERDETGVMALRRGFSVEPGMNIIIAEDVVTTGKSSGESAAILKAAGANITALACVVDRRAEGVTLDLPLFAAAAVSAENWAADDCELCKKGLPFMKPGSRR